MLAVDGPVVRHVFLRALPITAARFVLSQLLSANGRASVRLSGVLDRPGVLDHIMSYQDNRPVSLYRLMQCSEQVLERAEFNHCVFVKDICRAHDAREMFVDPVSLCRAMKAVGWRSSPRAVQQACSVSSRGWQSMAVSPLSLVLLADGVLMQDLPHVSAALCKLAVPMVLLLALAGFVITVHATIGTQGADPVGGWLFVAFIIPGSVCCVVELMPRWVSWLVAHKVQKHFTARGVPLQTEGPFTELQDMSA
eukprot:TRINITY_DN3735_c1_g2_i3.p1 TRINITY_DN3735_c1_g2~~TRINITY_DN3735_c1_g2_i3.p1  ORF type:complete len:252 (+),score=35.98 TRINITY_DN3735_c1_g2_i3:2-757(+)